MKSNQKFITIFTPTYNRKKQLINVYKSLIRQKNKDFIWLIIDDGSTDDTSILVNNWIKEDKITIEYFYKKNGGKHSAYNFSLDKINTEYVFIALDSDDEIVKDAIDDIKKICESKKEYNVIVGLCNISDGNINNVDISMYNNKSLSYVLSNYNFKHETSLIFKTEYLKKFKYPEIPRENFFTESFTYFQMDTPCFWVNKSFRNSTYLDDGLTKNRFKSYIKNPKSWYMYNKLRMIKVKSLVRKIKYCIMMICFGVLTNERKILSNSKYKILTIFMFGFGYILSIYIRIKGRQES